MIGCEAFVGRHTKRNQIGVSLLENLREIQTNIGRSGLLSSKSPSSPDSGLLEGKLSVLQDVVKEMDARHQTLLERSETAKREYHHKLESLEKDLKESRSAKGDQQRAISKIESVLEQEIEKHVLELESLEHTKDQEREKENEKLLIQNEESLDKLRKAFEDHVQELEEKLGSKEAEARALSEKLNQVEKGTSNVTTKKDAVIEELKEQIEAQKEQLDSAKSEESMKDDEDEKENTTKNSDPPDTSAIDALEAKHRDVVEDYKVKLDVLSEENEQLSSDLKEIDNEYKAKLDAFSEDRNKSLSKIEAKHQCVVEDYEARLDAMFAEKEEISSVLQTQHQEVVEGYETKLKDALSERDERSSDLIAMQVKCNEQVEIATASVKAAEAREMSLRKKSETLTKRVQLYWMAAKLVNLIVEQTDRDIAILSKQKKELEQENKELHKELQITKHGIQDLIEQLTNQTNMWQRLRSKVSRK